jgi:hypothetical protein
MLQVCLDALHNILKQTSEENLVIVTTEIEECGGRKQKKEICFDDFEIGLDKIENLQTHSNREIYQQCYEIIEKYFSNEDVCSHKISMEK